ncbi:hypothetical protein FNU76_04410 [Chitinimonas arctica]|uniref:Uncharacterized protein n=1 Tax=Chitinimonas arctica TaxID=2594795 RepID=A0A516SBY5_9NEIS|nr:hypothetical protein [Chitinimonas arctica]QDQ25653.1 hypothetical protein FNU76_04410 [Chitinimonas arctica]
MSPLWPKTVYASLFPGRRGLQLGRSAAPRWSEYAPRPAPFDLLAELHALLTEHAGQWRPGSRLVLTVSDSLAALAPLAWQPALQTPAEVEAYAQACFEQQGQPLDGEWVQHSDFRHHGRLGLAYALRRGWMAELPALCQAHGLRLRTVLPLSAAVYHRAPCAPGEGKRLLLLGDASRSTALLYDHAGLIGYDVEPAAGDAQAATTRLLRRLAALHGAIEQVATWSAATDDASSGAGQIVANLPGAVVQALTPSEWQ